MAKDKVKKSTLDISINSREKGIARMRDNIKKIREQADRDVAEIEKRIKEKQILLDALRRGKIAA